MAKVTRTKRKPTAKPDATKRDATTFWRAIQRVKPYGKNPRKNDKAVGAVAKSIAEFGWQQPIVIDRRGVVIVGHTRLLAAKQLGLSEVLVKVADLSEDKARAYRIADNQTGALSEWDLSLLTDEVQWLKEADLDLSLLGFDDRFLSSLVDGTLIPGITDPDEVPEVPKMPTSKPGDLWLLGDHRLLCGDSTKAEDVERLMECERADLLVTSPPYNQSIEKWRPSGMHKTRDPGVSWVGNVAKLAYPDSMPEPEYQRKQSDALAVWHEAINDGGSVFYNHKNRYRGKSVVSALEWLPGPFRWRQEIIWRRPGSVTQNARMFLPSDERIYWLYKGDDFYFSNSTEAKSFSTVWDVGLETNKSHPVAFPVEIPRRCITACSRKGEIVLDPYMGSGTTLIAAEQLGRRCFGLEIEPRFCDVIVARWEKFTGRKAERAKP